ncbi:heptaprenyl diphosphate synthase component 1 [Virgibacillus sediminis]|uniref:Heptaprenyl diphosphate synthase component 1 n=1 Tax=Virgibacillus sediminis TaxID=202260 RepID=A0ABV7A630_9BACI
METSSIDIRPYKAQIENKIQHAFLDKYIPKPVIDDEKLKILVAILNNSGGSDRQKQRYVLTAMLAQTALDTHDTVPAYNMENGWSIGNQLKVLAGDYYSGLYYLLLSEIDDFEFIHILASAIKEVNEVKMQLYYTEEGTFNDLMKMREEVESLIIRHIAEFLGDPFPVYIAGKWLVTHKLLQNMNSLKQTGELSITDVWMGQAVNLLEVPFSHAANETVQENLLQLERLSEGIPEPHQLYKEYLLAVVNMHNYNKAR